MMVGHSKQSSLSLRTHDIIIQVSGGTHAVIAQLVERRFRKA